MLLYLYGHEHPATLKDNQYQLCLPSKKKYTTKKDSQHTILNDVRILQLIV